MAGHSLGIAATQLTIARSVEVQSVGTIGTAIRRDNLSRMQRVGQLVNLLLTTDAHPLSVGLHDVTGIEVHFLGLQLQVATQVVVHLLHHSRPFGVTGIRLALMHQDALDDTILLCSLGQGYQSLVGVASVSFQHTLHPTWRSLHIALDAVGQKSLDVDATNRHMNDTNLDIFGQRRHHRTAKPVGRRQARVRTAKGGYGLTPLAHSASLLWEIHSGHQQESRARALQVLSLRTRRPLHIRLSETQEDIEVRVWRCLCPQQRHQHSYSKNEFFHHHDFLMH